MGNVNGSRADHSGNKNKNSISKPSIINGQEVTKKKLLASKVHRPHFENDPELLEDFSYCLSSVDDLKKKYLNLNWMETVEVYKSLEKQEITGKNQKKGNQIKDMFNSRSESVVSGDMNSITQNIGESQKKNGEELEEEENPEQWREEGEKMEELLKKNTLKIKIIIAEIAKSEIEKSLRRLISPILSNFNTFPEFGMFHSAIMIGPWYLEWNNSALCVPRKCVSQAALLTADIDAIQSTEKIEDVVDRLSRLIVHWNTSMKYKESNAKKGEEGNCQDFVDAILEELGLSLNAKGPLASFLQKLRKKGTCKMRFKMDEAFRSKFEITEKKVLFNSHVELDTFVEKLFDKCPEFDYTYKQEYSMLKSFDRAFWMRHLKSPSDDKWKPLYKSEIDDDGDTVMELACCFKDPRETYSFRFVN